MEPKKLISYFIENITGTNRLMLFRKLNYKQNKDFLGILWPDFC
jgi:hypothetical protein